MPLLLVNADDLGLHPDIDRGILDCVERGRVQSVSFSPIGQSVDWNKLRELQRNGVRVGLHVTLVGEPWATDGRLVPGWKDLVRTLIRPRSPMRAAVSREITRQGQLCAEHGLDPQTLSHIELVVHPGINTPALESRYHDWHFDWTGERDALLSQQFADSVAAAGFQFA